MRAGLSWLRILGDLVLWSAKTRRASCSTGQACVLVVKSVQDAVRHHTAGPIEAMTLALQSYG